MTRHILRLITRGITTILTVLKVSYIDVKSRTIIDWIKKQRFSDAKETALPTYFCKKDGVRLKNETP
jgi:hypothetical protein